MTKVLRRKNESFEGLFRRFNRRVQLSGQLLEAKKIRYREDEPNETRKKNSALRRVQIAEDRAYKIKTGQLKEEERRGGQRRS